MTGNTPKLRAVVVATVVGGVCAAATAAFLYQQPELRRLFRVVAVQAGHWVLYGALAWVAYFVGRLVTRAVFRREDTGWEAEWALGFVVTGWAAFALAAAHALHPWVVRGATLVFFALSVPTAWRFARGARERLEARAAAVSPGVWLLAAVAFPFALTLALGVGQPPFAWDALTYHVYLPKLFTEAHRLVYLPRLAYASMPLGGEMVFAWAYAWDGFGAPGAAATLLTALMAVATWRLARRYLEPLWAAVAVALLLFTPTFAELVDVPYVDFILGAYVLVALNIYLKGLARPRDAALAGVLLGAALDVKYTGVYALAAFGAVFAWDVARRKLSLRLATTLILTAFAVASPWLIKAYIERGNPVFPVFYNTFGGHGLSREAAAGVVRAMRDIGMGRGLTDYLLLPYRVSVMGGAGPARFIGTMWPFSFVAVPLSLFFFRRARVLLFTCFYFAAWGFIGSQQLRFFSAGFGAGAVVMAGVCAAATGAVRGRGKALVTFALIASLVIFGYGMNFGHIVNCWLRAIDAAGGDRERFLARWATCYAADKFVNDNAPPDAVVLMVFDYRLLYLERRAVYDSFAEASEFILAVQRMKEPEEVAAYVKSLGATYIMSDRSGAAYPWSYYDRATRVLWEAYLRDYTTVLYQDYYTEVRGVHERD